jgi:hypothetical protein
MIYRIGFIVGVRSGLEMFRFQKYRKQTISPSANANLECLKTRREKRGQVKTHPLMQIFIEGKNRYLTNGMAQNMLA